jgi:drug/metabolite transporter (DMT)-like permease
LATAFAHALLKAGGDKLAVQAWVRLTGLVIALPIALWVGAPPTYLVGWIIAAALVHAVYQYILTLSYQLSDFSLAYPLARGVAPLVSALLGIALLGDQASWMLIAGVALVSISILSLSKGSGISRAGFIAAAGAGLLTSAYTLVDAHGMRISPDAITFLCWFYVADGFSMPLAFALRARREAPAILASCAGHGIAAGILSLCAFVPALIAFRLAPVGAVAAIRETSVIIGLGISGFWLKETVDRHRVSGAFGITAGTLAIILAAAQTS